MMHPCPVLSPTGVLLRITRAAFLLIWLVVCSAENQSPVVGILSLPPQSGKPYYYIAASYVKWLESAGARSIPIAYDATDELLEEIFTQINGLLLPGGSAGLPQNAKKIWELVIESNSRGGYFPVWGTCLGMEFMLMLVGGESTIQSGFNAENISLPLIFPTEEDVMNSNGVFSIESLLYPEISQRQVLSSSNITMNNHHKGVTPNDFISEKKLASLFKITSTSIDRDGSPFVSTIESFQMPLYGTQYHPEKHNFEHGLLPNTTLPYEATNHSADAVALSIHLAFFFVGRVRKNTQRYDLVDRHPFVYQYEIKSDVIGFEQIYIIPSAQNWKNSTENYNDVTTEHENGATYLLRR